MGPGLIHWHPKGARIQFVLRRFLEEECPVTRVREFVSGAAGHDGGSWKSLCELGIAGLLIPETHGGSGLGLLDAAVASGG